MWPIQVAFLQAFISFSTLWNTSFFTQTVQLIFCILLQHITELSFLIYECPQFSASYQVVIATCRHQFFLYFNNFLKTTDILLPPTSHACAMGSNANAVRKENVTKSLIDPTVIKERILQIYCEFLCPTYFPSDLHLQNGWDWALTLNAELNPICHLLALLAHHILHVSRIRVNKKWLQNRWHWGQPLLNAHWSFTLRMV